MNPQEYAVAPRTVRAHRQYPHRAAVQGQSVHFQVEALDKGTTQVPPIPGSIVSSLLDRATTRSIPREAWEVPHA